MKCRKCGATIQPGERFCSNCGESVRQTVSGRPPAEGSRGQMSGSRQTSGSRRTSGSGRVQGTGKGSRRTGKAAGGGKLPLTAGIAAGAVVIAAAAVFLIHGKAGSGHMSVSGGSEAEAVSSQGAVDEIADRGHQTAILGNDTLYYIPDVTAKKPKVMTVADQLYFTPRSSAPNYTFSDDGQYLYFVSAAEGDTLTVSQIATDKIRDGADKNEINIKEVGQMTGYMARPDGAYWGSWVSYITDPVNADGYWFYTISLQTMEDGKAIFRDPAGCLQFFNGEETSQLTGDLGQCMLSGDHSGGYFTNIDGNKLSYCPLESGAQAVKLDEAEDLVILGTTSDGSLFYTKGSETVMMWEIEDMDVTNDQKYTYSTLMKVKGDGAPEVFAEKVDHCYPWAEDLTDYDSFYYTTCTTGKVNVGSMSIEGTLSNEGMNQVEVEIPTDDIHMYSDGQTADLVSNAYIYGQDKNLIWYGAMADEPFAQAAPDVFYDKSADGVLFDFYQNDTLDYYASAGIYREGKATFFLAGQAEEVKVPDEIIELRKNHLTDQDNYMDVRPSRDGSMVHLTYDFESYGTGDSYHSFWMYPVRDGKVSEEGTVLAGGNVLPEFVTGDRYYYIEHVKEENEFDNHSVYHCMNADEGSDTVIYDGHFVFFYYFEDGNVLYETYTDNSDGTTDYDYYLYDGTESRKVITIGSSAGYREIESVNYIGPDALAAKSDEGILFYDGEETKVLSDYYNYGDLSVTGVQKTFKAN